MNQMKRVIAVGIFIVFVIGGVKGATELVRYKGHNNNAMGLFYKEKRDSIDVMFLGSSEVYSAFSPMQMWGESGITSYNLSSASQPFPATYYLIKEAIRTQHPKVVVLEVFEMYEETDYYSIARLHECIDAMPLNKNKYDLMHNYLSRTMSFKEQLEFMFPIINYHDRIYNLEKKDYTVEKAYLRGFILRSKWASEVEPTPIVEKGDLYSYNMECLEQVEQLCKEQNIKLILCKTPLSSYWYYEDVMKQYNTVEEHAKAQNITYLNFDALRDEIGLDYSKDYADWIHLNAYGAEKLTSYVTKYIQDNCELTDHRGDSNYSDWEKEYLLYQKDLKKTKKKIEKKMEKVD